MASPAKKSKTEEACYKGTNEVPRTNTGKVLHVDVGPGEVANRIITVGTPSRAAALAAHFDGCGGAPPSLKTGKGGGVFVKESSRGFTTYTGTMGGVALSVVSIGMGTAMMDFLVRELRSVVEGPMLIVRFGTCGGLKADIPEGTVVVASQGSIHIARNPDAFTRTTKTATSVSSAGKKQKKTATSDEGSKDSGFAYYRVSRPQLPDAALSAAVLAGLQEALPETGAVPGMNVTADSFYASQGRADPNFNDRQAGLLEGVCEAHPELASMEMESFQLLHLANASTGGSIRATATAIVVANRPTGKVMDGDTLSHVESIGGKAVMQAVANHPLQAAPQEAQPEVIAVE